MYGDANEDGLINMQDVTKIERIIMEYDEPTETADANQDGVINMLDVTNIELIILGKIPHPGEGEIEIIKDTDLSKIIQVGDTLITMELNSEYTEAIMYIGDSDTQEEKTIEYYVKKDSFEYHTEVFSEGEYVVTYITEYNPLEPIETENEITTKQTQAIKEKVLYYLWDDVHFIKDDGIKYPHPDYSEYQLDYWDTEKIEGEELVHWHIKKKHSSFVAGSPPVIASAILALILKNPYLKVGDAILGYGLLVHSVESYADETGCIWVWYSEDYNFHFLPWPYLSYSYVPDYLRISSNTTWDFLDKGDP